MMFSLVSEMLRGRNILLRALVCAVGVTFIEFIFGVIFNLWLKMGVWDYSHMPMNILGQVCPLFTLLWVGVAIIFMPLVDVINRDYAIRGSI